MHETNMESSDIRSRKKNGIDLHQNAEHDTHQIDYNRPDT